MKRRIPPPLVMLCFAVLIFLTAALWPSERIGKTTIPYVGEGIFLSGILFLLYAAWCFRVQKTTVNPLNLDKSTALVISGPFKVTRNPMYLGMALLLVGCAIKTAYVVNVVWVWGFIFYITQVQIKPEEAAMERLFGQDYLAYKARVGRWI